MHEHTAGALIDSGDSIHLELPVSGDILSNLDTNLLYILLGGGERPYHPLW